MKKYKTRIFGVLAAFLLIALCIYQASNSQFVYNEEHADGTTPGNLFNNGLFCQYGDQIYFSNLKDDGKLYVMDADFQNFEKLSSDKVSYINVAGNHIIYSRINNKKTAAASSSLQSTPVGIYRCSLEGEQLATLDTSAKGMVHQYGNQIYFQTYSKENAYSFNTMDIKGEEGKLLMNDPIAPGSIVMDTLYYAGVKKDLSVHTLNLDTMEHKVLLKGRYANVTANNGYLYMLDVSDKYSIIRTDMNGKNKETLVSSRTCTFNLSGDGTYLYYQVDNNKNNGVHRLNLKTMDDELLIEGNYSNINVTDQYVFFTDLKETSTYAVKIGEKEEVQLFTAPVIK